MTIPIPIITCHVLQALLDDYQAVLGADERAAQ